MGRVTKTELIESAEQLLKMSKKIAHPLAGARLRAFYLYKSGQAKAYGQIAAAVGYERHAVGQWFRLYKQKGLQACLQIDPGGHKRASQIAGKVLEQLKAKLADPNNYFTSYKQIHEWLHTAHGIDLSYEHVHWFVHRQLGAKLKVVRKSNLKKDLAYEQKYKKN
ncbi:helix-turn-helix domain-containing protein [Rhodocytophaga rosea]|uniref:Helix-turn-helix domain-containing protein n=1 Tax=Rhodocytophaga rosea TaxID=2704465 RepID=A0A6C0GLG0_9BACT|nr:helix-turn-helix domain-containing protein [Rhodocytophaga rosea]QHT65685.1 helix-turn-helix domain-containing protein [Rhodocytophaga rosea]QHT66094.1 helix-turn-helix domain-containing protein [Rhodocytophaga rosea]QHT66222.1 helix-turn-helix domain-containing protein [Rhodocytophaga rosea]QHT66306.1 helix-turn-helix domain-containing protein [Rhodocytophaga rosea]QHT67163.1 helix-turn-helix domain-containing protein [Rhodocytophaga rosea]